MKPSEVKQKIMQREEEENAEERGGEEENSADSNCEGLCCEKRSFIQFVLPWQ